MRGCPSSKDPAEHCIDDGGVEQAKQVAHCAQYSKGTLRSRSFVRGLWAHSRDRAESVQVSGVLTRAVLWSLVPALLRSLQTSCMILRGSQGRASSLQSSFHRLSIPRSWHALFVRVSRWLSRPHVSFMASHV